jgi:hypothetical protein
MEKRNDVEEISKILQTRPNGFTISQIKEKSKLPKCAVISALDKLEGAEKVNVIFFGRSKVYSWKKK